MAPNDQFIIHSTNVYFKHLKLLRENNYDLCMPILVLLLCSLSGRLTKPLVFDMHGDLLQELLLRCGYSLNLNYDKLLAIQNNGLCKSKGSDQIICVIG